ncbi:tRNA pseudouridine(55) synthase TruB [Tsuneonella mangrovi]|uniref:tRNA pseudouridine(55) synthase TruB n=1 Tax=Tsuneonella mangrovi TaxID=1982042 RepID=UPI000BA25E26|nr:tRNA pseudouridine(55) synthase TruB [Tsuneonella mangrovi]
MNGAKPAPNGWLILDKPRGLGSTQAVGAVKRNLRTGGYAGTKVGHGGTLDPLAEGVLPIALGEATKLAGRMLDSDKIYEFTIQFGEQTDTLDAEGEVVATSPSFPSLEQVEGILRHFIGPIRQVPPKYSALKIDGRRAYDLARAGEEVALEARQVTIHSLKYIGCVVEDVESRVRRKEPSDLGERIVENLNRNVAKRWLRSISLRANVSKGTYIRSLARDIAHALGTVGHVTYLRRTKAGPFSQSQAISLDLLEEIGKGAALEDHLLPLEAGLDGIPAHDLDPESAQAVRQGRVLSGMPHPDGLLFVRSAGVPVALMEVSQGTAKVVRGFNYPDTAE